MIQPKPGEAAPDSATNTAGSYWNRTGAPTSRGGLGGHAGGESEGDRVAKCRSAADSILLPAGSGDKAVGKGGKVGLVGYPQPCHERHLGRLSHGRARRLTPFLADNN